MKTMAGMKKNRFQGRCVRMCHFQLFYHTDELVGLHDVCSMFFLLQTDVCSIFFLLQTNADKDQIKAAIKAQQDQQIDNASISTLSRMKFTNF